MAGADVRRHIVRRRSHDVPGSLRECFLKAVHRARYRGRLWRQTRQEQPHGWQTHGVRQSQPKASDRLDVVFLSAYHLGKPRRYQNLPDCTPTLT
eukprot:5707118-Pleurochrysis_carterae.AAC.2